MIELLIYAYLFMAVFASMVALKVHVNDLESENAKQKGSLFVLAKEIEVLKARVSELERKDEEHETD